MTYLNSNCRDVDFAHAKKAALRAHTERNLNYRLGTLVESAALRPFVGFIENPSNIISPRAAKNPMFSATTFI